MGFPHAAPEDEQTMQAFIRSQMYSIMHPVAEHVREVQAQVQQLAKRVTATDGKIDETKVCVENQHDEFLGLRRNLSDHDTSLERLKDSLDTAHREKEKLGVDHEITKTDLAKIATDLRTSNALLKAMQQKCEDLEGDVRSLHTGAEKIGKTFAQEAEKIAQTRELANSLNLQQVNIVQRVDELAQSGAEHNKGLHKLARQYEKANGVVNSELARLQEHIDSLDGRLTPSQQDVQANKDAIRNIEERLRLMKTGSDGATDVSSNPTGKPDGTDVIAKVQSDIEGLKGTLGNLQDLFTSYKEDHTNLHKDLDRRLGDAVTHLEGLIQAVKEGTGSHLQRHDGHLSKVQRTLDAVGGQVDMLQADQKSMGVNLGDLGNKVDSHRIALTKTQAELKHTGGLVDSANEGLVQLKGGLAAMDTTISKLGSRYDHCTRNVHGVGRGLADVGRHVAQGDHGMLPPKSPQRSRFPSLALGASGGLDGSLHGSLHSAR